MLPGCGKEGRIHHAKGHGVKKVFVFLAFCLICLWAAATEPVSSYAEWAEQRKKAEKEIAKEEARKRKEAQRAIARANQEQKEAEEYFDSLQTFEERGEGEEEAKRNLAEWDSDIEKAMARIKARAERERILADVEYLTVKQYVREYRENAIRADLRFKGKRVRLEGTISDLTLVDHDTPGVLLSRRVYCFFSKDQAVALATQVKGNVIQVLGLGGGRVGHNLELVLFDCIFLPAYD